MAKGFAIHNAPTDHGGVIPSTQQRTSQMGNLFVRQVMVMVTIALDVSVGQRS